MKHTNDKLKLKHGRIFFEIYFQFTFHIGGASQTKILIIIINLYIATDCSAAVCAYRKRNFTMAWCVSHARGKHNSSFLLFFSSEFLTSLLSSRSTRHLCEMLKLIWCKIMSIARIESIGRLLALFTCNRNRNAYERTWRIRLCFFFSSSKVVQPVPVCSAEFFGMLFVRIKLKVPHCSASEQHKRYTENARNRKFSGFFLLLLWIFGRSAWRWKKSFCTISFFSVFLFFRCHRQPVIMGEPNLWEVNATKIFMFIFVKAMICVRWRREFIRCKMTIYPFECVCVCTALCECGEE